MKKQRPIHSDNSSRNAASSDSAFCIPVFLSVAFPYNKLQRAFLEQLIAEQRARLLFPRTLGVTDASSELAAGAIRRMISSSYGMMAVAFRRSNIRCAEVRPGSARESVVQDTWVTSPYVQIEPSMAFQSGLPLLILREQGVAHDGVFGGLLEQGVLQLRIPEFSVENARSIDSFFRDMEWKIVFEDWVADVRQEYRKRTEPRRQS